jgi:hypothetical protein
MNGASSQPQEAEIDAIAALNRLTELATSYGVSQIFRTACQVGVFEQLQDGPLSAEELAPRTQLHPDGCRRLLAALRQLGLVDDDDGRFRNSDVGQFLTSGSPLQLEPLSMWATPFYRMWEFLPDALRNLEPVWQQALGTTAEQTFAALYEDPARLRRFTRIMNAYSIPIGREIARRFDFSSYRCLLDVAGSAGGQAIQIGLRYPHLQGIVMDLPPVCAVADEDIEAAGLADRFRAEAADLFAGPYPAGADVAILSWILHDWSDDSCRVILRNCFETLPSGGVLLVSEAVLNDDLSGSDHAVFLSLHMAVCCEPGARERTESEYRALLEDAGFTGIEVIRFGAPRDVVVARKP